MNWEGIEKRRFVRANFPCKIVIYTPTQHILASHTENIGAGGVRVIIEQKLEISSNVGLEIYLEKEPITCKGKIVWVVEKVNPISKKSFLFDTGLEFIDIKEDDRLVINNLVETIVSNEK